MAEKRKKNLNELTLNELKKNVVPDPKFKSTIIPKLINNIMYDGKRGIAAKIVYDASK